MNASDRFTVHDRLELAIAAMRTEGPPSAAPV
jgi:hypothetical protein